MAIWELNKVLLARRKNPNDLKEYKNEFAQFEELLKINLPSEAYRTKDGIDQPHPKLYNVLNPSLSLDEKVLQVENMKFLNFAERLLVLESMNYAINEYVSKRAYEIFLELGGKSDEFNNVLVAAGDGSGTSGLLEEREKDAQGRWNKGLPKAVGLFPYQLIVEEIQKKRKTTKKIEPLRYAIEDFYTAHDNHLTNIHLDVWGYNSEKQTTVVIEKGGLSYHLFGSTENRFLSPDSSFSEGATFQAIINDLEFNKIGKLDDKIHGRRGYDYWIEYNTKKKNSTEIKLKKKEMEYSNLGYTSIYTDPKASRKVKKSKKKAIKSGSPTFNGTPTTHAQKDERRKLQDQIVELEGRYEAYISTIKKLEEEKQIAIDLRATYELKLDHYKRLMGYHWAEYTEKDGLYIFEDSSTFDYYTQEFQFPPSKDSVEFEVRLIAIPESCLSKSADEVMLHVNVMDAKPDYNARINLVLNDVFASDRWELYEPLFTDEDSVALKVFFEGLLDKKTSFDMIARGHGVGKWNGAKTIKDNKPEELNAYPGNPEVTKMDSTFQRLRRSEVIIHINRGIRMEVNSFTDPVKSSLKVTNESLLAAKTKYKFTENDILSAYRTATIMLALQKEINVLAAKYMSREDASIVIDRFNKQWGKTKISVGPTSFKLSTFK